MSRRVARVLATSVLIFALASLTVSISLSLAARSRLEPGQIVVIGDRSEPRMQEVLRDVRAERDAGDPLQQMTGDISIFAVFTLLLAAWIGVGVMIVWRQATNWAGWLFIITGVAFPFAALTQTLMVYGLKADPGSVPLQGLWAVVGEYSLYPIALIPLLFLLYPDGHPPSPRWRWAIAGLIGGTTAAVLGFAVRPGPYNAWIADGILYANPIGIGALAEISDRRHRRRRRRDPRVGSVHRASPSVSGSNGPPARTVNACGG